MQLLRIDPAVSEYDWLVQNYNELKRTTKGQRTGTSNEDRTNISNGGTGITRTEITSGNRNTTGTDRYTDNTEGGGTGSNIRELDDEHTRSGTESIDGTTTGKTTNGGYDTDTRTLATTDSRKTTNDLTNTIRETGWDSSNSQGKSEDQNLRNAVRMDKANPMSISYSAPQTADGLYHDSFTGAEGLPNLNWQTATNQAQEGEKDDTSHKESASSSSNNSLDRTDKNTGTQSVTGSQGGTITDRHDKGSTVTTEGTKGETRTTGETLSNSGTITDTKNDHREEEKTHSGTHTEQATTSDNKETSETASNHKTDRGTLSGSSSMSESGGTYERSAGRSVDIATLLTNAKSFIEQSEAWEWLSDRIEPCFMGILDYEPDDCPFYF